MDASCRRALELGLPAIAFTDHADFTDYVRAQNGIFDVHAYLDCVERCRARYHDLRILSGVELGEPHRFRAEADAILLTGKLDRVLGSVHCAPLQGRLQDAGQPGFHLTATAAPGFMSLYFEETLGLLASSLPFAVLAHLDYPKRYWPHAELPYRESAYEEQYRTVLRAAARRGTILEVNTTRGAEPHRGLCPGPTVLRWWHEEGGEGVCFGSDAHDPLKVAQGFAYATPLVEAAGFRAAPEPTACWRRG